MVDAVYIIKGSMRGDNKLVIYMSVIYTIILRYVMLQYVQWIAGIIWLWGIMAYGVESEIHVVHTCIQNVTNALSEMD